MPDAAPRVFRADARHLDALAELADAFRQLNGAEAARDATRDFLADGMATNATVLAAELQGQLAGFTHIVPAVSLLRLDRLWTVTALYVRPEARRRGVALALVDATRTLAAVAGADALQISAGWDNVAARGLFGRLGYERDLLYTTYEHKL